MNNPKRSAPKAILDNLAVIGDRRYRIAQASSVDRFFTGTPVDGAGDDYVWTLKFLKSYDGSTDTFNAYRRELERLLQWSWHIEQRSVRTLNRDDIEDFIRFLLKPPLAWIGTKNVARFVDQDGERTSNPDWRPFIVTAPKSASRKKKKKLLKREDYTVSQPSIKATFAALSSFYDYLVEESVAVDNPVALIRQKSKFVRKDHNRAPVRRISNLEWEYVIETAKLMAEENPGEHERTLFILRCLFGMYLRISELVANERSVPVMGDFRKDVDDNWWFHVTGKGNKNRTIVVSEKMLKALERYRASRGLLPALPPVKDDTPLIPKTRGKGPVTTTRMIRRIVQACFDRAYRRMRNEGFYDNEAWQLKEATVHWLRHTGISVDVKKRPREHVRDDAGHASMATTDRYIDSDQRERHASGKMKPLENID